MTLFYRHNKPPLNPNREPMADQSKDTNYVRLGESISFIGVTYRNMGKELLQEQKWLRDSCVTRAHPSMDGSS